MRLIEDIATALTFCDRCGCVQVNTNLSCSICDRLAVLNDLNIEAASIAVDVAYILASFQDQITALKSKVI